MKKIAAYAMAFILSVSVWSSAFSTGQISQVEVANINGSGAQVYVESQKQIIELTAATAKTATPDDGDFFDEPQVESLTKVSDNFGYINNEILVFFENGTPFLKKLEIAKSIGANITGYLGILNRYQFRVESTDIEGIQAICNELMENDEVALASCNFAIKYQNTNIPEDPWTEGDGIEYTYGWDESLPAGSNWWLEAIQAMSAWEYNEYFNHIGIGIVDSGFDNMHEDLCDVITFPNAKLERQNSIDDHGTHVAGIIAASANNGKGITGICHNVTLHCVDWEPEDLQLWLTAERLLTGLAYTVRDGAKVINYSVGSSLAVPETEFFLHLFNVYLDIEAKVVSYVMATLLNEGYDFIVVQSAGNDSIDAHYNSLFCSINEHNAYAGKPNVSAQDIIDRIIVVGAAENLGNGNFQQAYFSNGGDRVDICAPGYGIFSCYASKNGGYGYMSGTSMASPIVTAVTALVWSVDPSLSGDVVKSIVCDPENTCYEVEDNTSEIHPLVDTYRMVNAKLAVEAAIELLHPTELE